MQKSFTSFALAAGIVLAVAGYAQQPAKEQQLPNELVQYVRDARKAGVKENQIQQNAVNAGWPADVVSSAISLVLHPTADKTAPPQSAATATAKSEPAPASLTAEPPTAKSTEPPPTAAPAGAAPVAKPDGPAPAPAAAERRRKNSANQPARQTGHHRSWRAG